MNPEKPVLINGTLQIEPDLQQEGGDLFLHGKIYLKRDGEYVELEQYFYRNGVLTKRFTTPLNIWQVAHPFQNPKPVVKTYDPLGFEMMGQVQYITDSVVAITFVRPVSGSEVIME